MCNKSTLPAPEEKDITIEYKGLKLLEKIKQLESELADLHELLMASRDANAKLCKQLAEARKSAGVVWKKDVPQHRGSHIFVRPTCIEVWRDQYCCTIPLPPKQEEAREARDVAWENENQGKDWASKGEENLAKNYYRIGHCAAQNKGGTK